MTIQLAKNIQGQSDSALYLRIFFYAIFLTLTTNVCSATQLDLDDEIAKILNANPEKPIEPCYIADILSDDLGYHTSSDNAHTTISKWVEQDCKYMVPHSESKRHFLACTALINDTLSYVTGPAVLSLWAKEQLFQQKNHFETLSSLSILLYLLHHHPDNPLMQDLSLFLSPPKITHLSQQLRLCFTQSGMLSPIMLPLSLTSLGKDSKLTAIAKCFFAPSMQAHREPITFYDIVWEFCQDIVNDPSLCNIQSLYKIGQFLLSQQTTITAPPPSNDPAKWLRDSFINASYAQEPSSTISGPTTYASFCFFIAQMLHVGSTAHPILTTNAKALQIPKLYLISKFVELAILLNTLCILNEKSTSLSLSIDFSKHHLFESYIKEAQATNPLVLPEHILNPQFIQHSNPFAAENMICLTLGMYSQQTPPPHPHTETSSPHSIRATSNTIKQLWPNNLKNTISLKFIVTNFLQEINIIPMRVLCVPPAHSLLINTLQTFTETSLVENHELIYVLSIARFYSQAMFLHQHFGEKMQNIKPITVLPTSTFDRTHLWHLSAFYILFFSLDMTPPTPQTFEELSLIFQKMMSFLPPKNIPAMLLGEPYSDITPQTAYELAKNTLNFFTNEPTTHFTLLPSSYTTSTITTDIKYKPYCSH